MDYSVNSLEETYDLAKKFIRDLPRFSLNKNAATVVGLFGDLGAGKTSFTQGVARVLGVKDNVTSPTFVLEKIYCISKKGGRNFERLVHIDAYRMDNPKEILKLDWEEIKSDPKNLILVEWPERVLGEMPESFIKITFEPVGSEEGKRKIKIES